MQNHQVTGSPHLLVPFFVDTKSNNFISSLLCFKPGTPQCTMVRCMNLMVCHAAIHHFHPYQQLNQQQCYTEFILRAANNCLGCIKLHPPHLDNKYCIISGPGNRAIMLFDEKDRCSATGNRTRGAWVKTRNVTDYTIADVVASIGGCCLRAFVVDGPLTASCAACHRLLPCCSLQFC